MNAPRYTTQVPAGRPVVVEPDHWRIARRYLKRLAVVAVLIAAWVWAGTSIFANGQFGFDRPDIIAWMVAGFVLLIIFAMVAVRWRGESRGPLLVGDHDGLWVRMGGTIKVRGLFLPWQDVERLTIRKRRRAAILCIESELGEAIVRQHADDLLMEVRRRRRWVDSSFAVHSKFARGSLPRVLEGLRGLAGDRVVVP